MNVQDRANLTPDARLQPRVGEMAPTGMHVIPHQRGVLESGGNYIGTAIGIQRMAVEPSTFIKELQIAHFLVKTMNNSLTQIQDLSGRDCSYCYPFMSIRGSTTSHFIFFSF